MKALENNALVISAILAKLLEVGISRDFLSDRDFDLPEDLREFVWPCICWLANEGLVTSISENHRLQCFTWRGLTLTSRGIAPMGTRFEVDGKRVSIADFVQAPKDRNWSSSVVGEFLGGALGGFTKAVSS